MRVIPKLSRIQASVHLPGSRAETLRALLLAAITPGNVRIANALDVDETRLVFDTIRKIGWDTAGSFGKELLIANRAGISANEVEIELGDSETAMRWLLPFLSFTPGRTMIRLTGELDVRALVEDLRAIGAEIEYPYDEGRPPLQVRGKLIRGGADFRSEDVAAVQSMAIVARTFPDGLSFRGERLAGDAAPLSVEVPPEPFLVAAWQTLTDRVGGRITVNGRTHEAGAPHGEIEARTMEEREAARAISGLATGTVTVENDALLARAFPRFWRVLDEVVASSGLIDAAVPKE